MPKVAVVEDNELNLKLFRDLLLTEALEVVDTMDGTKAYDLINNERPDLILMDIQLQGMSGLDVIRQVKADDQLKDIPIIAVTAFAMKDDEAKIMESGCDAYISKPISILSFMERVRFYLGIKEEQRMIC